ncbi:MAG: FtsK/SpoIIIE domain-containing protein [Planctomycetaceae bacterium]
MPRIVCICDEYADLLESSDRTERQAIEKQLRRISARGRAAGIHLILATQQPRATVITPAIRAMLPTGGLASPDARRSRIAIDDPGAERLLGNGDLLFRSIGTQRLQELGYQMNGLELWTTPHEDVALF